MLNVGITGQAVCRVDKENTAAALGSGMLEVFATPAMISLIERAACESVQPYLDAVKLAPERVRAFLVAVLTHTPQTRQPVRRRGQDMEL